MLIYDPLGPTLASYMPMHTSRVPGYIPLTARTLARAALACTCPRATRVQPYYSQAPYSRCLRALHSMLALT